jgi:hypothetical protein
VGMALVLSSPSLLPPCSALWAYSLSVNALLLAKSSSVKGPCSFLRKG